VTTTQDADLLIHSTATWEIAAISAPSGFEIGDGAAIISGRSVAIAHNLDAGVAGPTGDVTAFLSSPMSSYAYLLAAKLAPADAGALPVPLATATADALPPTLLVGVKPPRALATAAALAPTLRVSVSVPLATATATALVPTVTVTGGVTAVTVPLATATADAFAPAVPMVVTPPRATATVAALAPRPTVAVVPPLATVQAQAYVPAQVNPGVIVVLPPTATASAVAFVPFVRVYHRAVAHGSLVLAPALTATISLTMAMTTGTLTFIPAATGGIVAEAA
jgi:hypothetical protein